MISSFDLPGGEEIMQEPEHKPLNVNKSAETKEKYNDADLTDLNR